MTAQRTSDTAQCESHADLMQMFGGIRADLGWLKKAFWTVPVLFLAALIAFAGYIRSIDNRLTVCETQMNMMKDKR